MEVILGAGGGTAKALTEVLAAQDRPVRLVGRKPHAQRPNETAFAADLLDPAAAREAVAGCDIAYMLVGLPYNTKLWEETWPLLIENVLDACTAAGAALVFLDNVYLYDPEHMAEMTEETPINPVSRKGKVRAEVARAVLEAHASGRVRTLIARSADFYGPGVENSVMQELMGNAVVKGNRGQWLVKATVAHSFTYVPDIGRALAQLGTDKEAYGRVWHLPTSSEAPTGEQWTKLFADAAGQEYKKPLVLRPWMLRLAGLFQPDVAALHEMLYQYDRPYRFRSDAFTARYGWEATPIVEGVRAVTQVH